MTTQNCVSCRHHTCETIPIPADDAGAGVTDNLLIAEDTKVYFCRAAEGPHAGKRVGSTPVQCPAWSAPTPVNTEQLDALMARMASRRR